MGPPGPKGKTKPETVKDRFASIPSGPHFYNVYGRLSENTHAGLTSASAYLGAMLKHGGPVPARPDRTDWAESLALLCWSCWTADDAMLRFVVGGEATTARHAPLMARVGLATG